MYLLRIEPRFRKHAPTLSRRSLAACAVLLAPMGVGIEIPVDSVGTDAVEVGDSSAKVTRFTLGGGQGQYVRTIHDERVITLPGGPTCDGGSGTSTMVIDADFKFKQEYTDAGAEIDHQVSDRFHVGVRGGGVKETATYLGSNLNEATLDTLFEYVGFDDEITYFYLNPYFAAENRDWGWGLGFVASNGHLWVDQTRDYGEHDDATIYPTGHLRLGRRDRGVYINGSFWESVPIYSGGGVFTAGLGTRIVRPIELWGGVAVGGPYSDYRWLVRANVDLGQHLTLGANLIREYPGESSPGETPSQYGTSFSLGYKWIRD